MFSFLLFSNFSENQESVLDWANSLSAHYRLDSARTPIENSMQSWILKFKNNEN